ncbi:hypothetical protein [Methanothrix soehngenii]|uniref:hypothetical protein n=1 Tax=Methanothrix soehngenii TaxID=2223 RepID=UPI00300CE76D
MKPLAAEIPVAWGRVENREIEVPVEVNEPILAQLDGLAGAFRERDGQDRGGGSR